MATETNRILPDQKEKELRECLKGGNQYHFSMLYDTYAAALFGLICNWIKDRGHAENLLQDVFVKAWKNREQYDPGKGRIFTWLYNITRNICIDHFRSRLHKDGKSAVLSDNEALLLPPVKMDGFLPDTIGLRKLVDALRPEEKQVVELMYFKGFTQSEIAMMMKIPLGTVKTRINMAIKNLRYFFKKDMNRAMNYISLN